MIQEFLRGKEIRKSSTSWIYTITGYNLEENTLIVSIRHFFNEAKETEYKTHPFEDVIYAIKTYQDLNRELYDEIKLLYPEYLI